MIGKELKKSRLKAGLTQEELASKADLHFTYISLIERDKKSPTIRVFLRLCRVLNVSPSRFMAKIQHSSK